MAQKKNKKQPEQVNRPKKSEKAKNQKKAAPKKGKDGKAAKPSLWARFVAYVKNVKSEMQRVIWPTRKELISASLVVIGALLFFGIYIAIIDNIVLIPLDALGSLGR